MKIANTQTNYSALATNQSTSVKVEQKKVATSSNSFVSSATSEPIMDALRNAQTKLESMPDVDMEKVAKLKETIQSGHIVLDPKKLSQAMLKYHQGQ